MLVGMNILGIDVGGSGIKGAPVDLALGDFAEARVRIPTPSKSSPKNVAAVVAEIVENFKERIPADSRIGLTIPAPVVHGKVPFMANLHKSWAGLEAATFFEDHLGRPVTLVNDADAAGLAEVHYGAAKGNDGLVIMTTLGTGIGSAIIHRGVLVPNAELGHVELDGLTRRPGRPPPSRTRRSSATRRGPCVCSATTATSRCCSPPTCSSSAVGCRRIRRSSCPC